MLLLITYIDEMIFNNESKSKTAWKLSIATVLWWLGYATSGGKLKRKFKFLDN